MHEKIKEGWARFNKKVLDPAYQFLGSNTFFIILLSWFVVQTVYMALTTDFRIPPDERWHFQFIQLYAESGLLPFLQDQTGYYSLGDVTREAGYLYHYLLSFPYRALESFEIKTIVNVLRLFSVAFGAVSLLMVRKIGRIMGIPYAVTNISIFMLTGTMMFIFLFASLNYQTLLILVSLIAFYLLLKLSKEFKLITLLLLLVMTLLGAMIKYTFLPLALIITVLVLVETFLNRDKVFKKVKKEWLSKRVVFLPIVLIVLVLGGLFIERYVLNQIVFEDFKPSCDIIHTVEQCEKYPIYARAQNYPENTEVSNIPSPYFVARYAEAMRDRSFRITAHKTLHTTSLVATGTTLLAGLMLLAVIRKYQFKNSKILTYAITVSSFYLLVLLLTNYYLAYSQSGQFGIALQGRYAFPVLPIIYLAGNYYVFKLLQKKWLILLYIIMTVALLFPAVLPHYITGTDSEWHQENMQGINRSLQEVLN